MLRILAFTFFLLPLAVKAQVNILDFRANPAGDALNISWTIGPGNTCEDLEVQHSTDSANFTMLYLYAGVCGDATFSQQYSWTHNTPACNQKNFYRLYARTGGQLAVLSVTHTCLGAAGYRIVVRPDLQGIVVLTNLQQSPTRGFELFDLQGRIVVKETLTEAETIIRLPAAAAGVFVYRIRRENGEIQTGRIAVAY
ncbi:MAG: T9SS type A sorting domain-containing protein [Bacteroidia bacterium]